MIHPLDCHTVTTRLALGDLKSYGWKDRWMIRFHLAICWICRKYERQVKVIGRAFGVLVETRRQESDLEAFKQRLLRNIRP